MADNFHQCSFISHNSCAAKERADRLWEFIVLFYKVRYQPDMPLIPPLLCGQTPGFMGYEGSCIYSGGGCADYGPLCPLCCADLKRGGING